MNIKRTTKIVKFLIFTTLSFFIGFLAVILSKKEEYGYMSLIKKEDSVVHADVPCSTCGCAWTQEQCSAYVGGGDGDGGDGGSILR